MKVDGVSVLDVIDVKAMLTVNKIYLYSKVFPISKTTLTIPVVGFPKLAKKVKVAETSVGVPFPLRGMADFIVPLMVQQPYELGNGIAIGFKRLVFETLDLGYEETFVDEIDGAVRDRQEELKDPSNALIRKSG